MMAPVRIIGARIAVLGICVLGSATTASSQALGNFSVPDPQVRLLRDCIDCPELVALPNKLAMGRFHVTRGEFARFAEATRFRQTGWGCVWNAPQIEQDDRHPVVCVSRRDALAYVDWLSQRTGRRYRLPTSAELREAAGERWGTRFAWGNRIGVANANCTGCGSEWDGEGTAPVGSFKPNVLGLHDVTGNAWQWTSTCHDAGCQEYVLRGGAWSSSPADLSLSMEIRNAQDGRFNSYGFRVVREID